MEKPTLTQRLVIEFGLKKDQFKMDGDNLYVLKTNKIHAWLIANHDGIIQPALWLNDDDKDWYGKFYIGLPNANK